jgi:hypothetical protein
LSNGFKNDSDFLGESGGSAPHEDQDLELKKQELELCQTDPQYTHPFIASVPLIGTWTAALFSLLFFVVPDIYFIS